MPSPKIIPQKLQGTLGTCRAVTKISSCWIHVYVFDGRALNSYIKEALLVLFSVKVGVGGGAGSSYSGENP